MCIPCVVRFHDHHNLAANYFSIPCTVLHPSSCFSVVESGDRLTSNADTLKRVSFLLGEWTETKCSANCSRINPFLARISIILIRTELRTQDMTFVLLTRSGMQSLPPDQVSSWTKHMSSINHTTSLSATKHQFRSAT